MLSSVVDDGKGKWLLQLAKTDVLVLDDWGMGPSTA